MISVDLMQPTSSLHPAPRPLHRGAPVQSRLFLPWLFPVPAVFLTVIVVHPFCGTARQRGITPWLQIIESYSSVHGKWPIVTIPDTCLLGVLPYAAVWIWIPLQPDRTASQLTAEKMMVSDCIKLHRWLIGKVLAPIACHLVLKIHFSQWNPLVNSSSCRPGMFLFPLNPPQREW